MHGAKKKMCHRSAATAVTELSRVSIGAVAGPDGGVGSGGRRWGTRGAWGSAEMEWDGMGLKDN